MNMTTPHSRAVFVVDGTKFSTLAEAGAEFTRALGFTSPWAGSLCALSVMLRGGFGTPNDDFALVWRHSDVSRKRLGYEETVRWCERELTNGHPSMLPATRQGLQEAQQRCGATVFDWLEDIIRSHRHIELRLE